MPRRDAGAALLEAIVALAILATAGLALLRVVRAATDSERGMAQRERALVTVERLMTAHALLTRADLDRRLGRREIGEFVVEIQRPDQALYRIAIAEVAHPEIEALVTVVYRPEERP